MIRTFRAWRRHRGHADWLVAMRCRARHQWIQGLWVREPGLARYLACEYLHPDARFVLWGGRGGDIWVGGYMDSVIAWGAAAVIWQVFPERHDPLFSRMTVQECREAHAA